LKAKIVYAVLAGAGVALAAVYMIRLFQRSMHNPLQGESRDLKAADTAVLAPLVAAILFLALYPQLVLHRSERSVGASVRAPALVAHHQPPAEARR
jgi:NADH-quinone oxidoreductase subunit M